VIARVNLIRNENPALQGDAVPTFQPVDNDQLIAWTKSTDDLSNVILTVVNLDPHYPQSGWVDLPLADLGLPAGRPYQVEDLLTGMKFTWSGPRNYLRLDPAALPAHILALQPHDAPVTYGPYGRRSAVHRHPSHLRDAAGLQDVPPGGALAWAQGDHRARPQPHLRPAPLVPAGTAGPAGQRPARLLRLERHSGPLQGCPHHLQGLRDVELGLGPGGEGLLLAPLLLPPARPELGQPRGQAGDVQRRGFLARPGRRRAAPGCRALPHRAGGHRRGEPPRDPRDPEGAAGTRRRAVRGPHAAGRGQPVARGRQRLLRRWRRMPHGLPLPPDAPPLHVHP